MDEVNQQKLMDMVGDPTIPLEEKMKLATEIIGDSMDFEIKTDKAFNLRKMIEAICKNENREDILYALTQVISGQIFQFSPKRQ